MSVKKVLFLSYDGMTDPLGQSQVIPYLGGLSRKGYQITLLSFEKPEKFSRLGNFIQTKLDGLGIRWRPLTFHSKPRIISKWWDIQLMKREAAALHKEQRFDLIHCRSYIAADIGLDLKRRTGVKLLFDMRGFWADEKADGGNWNKESFFWKQVYAYYKKKEKELLTEADHIISLTQAAKDEMVTWSFYNKRVPITVIPCCADAELFSLTSEDQQLDSRKLIGIPQDAFVLSYLGSVGTWYMLEEMLHFFSHVKKKYANALFLFISNSDSRIIKDKLSDYSLKETDVRIVQVNYSDVPKYMKASDISISFIRPVYSKIASSPTKNGETLCMGIPLLANSIGDSKEIINNCNAGLIVEEFTPFMYDQIVQKLQTLMTLNKEEIRRKACDVYGLRVGVKKYEAVYEELLESAKSEQNLTNISKMQEVSKE